MTVAVHSGIDSVIAHWVPAATGPFTDQSASAIPAMVFFLPPPRAGSSLCQWDAAAVDLETSRSSRTLHLRARPVCCLSRPLYSLGNSVGDSAPWGTTPSPPI